mgnify:CR=1 FL=1
MVDLEQGNPLSGVRVIDLTSNVAAPFGGAVLADLGADVIHVEGPSGDDCRRMSPVMGDSSAYFHGPDLRAGLAPLDLDPRFAAAVAASPRHRDAGFMAKREELLAGSRGIASGPVPVFGEQMPFFPFV